MLFAKYLRDRRNSFTYAARGIRFLVASQAHARIHSVAAVMVVLAAWALNVSPLEWCVLLLTIALVWVSEAINTALELVVDLASPDFHPLAGKAKDVAAGAVLLASLLATIIGGIIFWPKLAFLF